MADLEKKEETTVETKTEVKEESTETEKKEETKAKEEVKEEKLFTQADIDNAVKARLAREKKSSQDDPNVEAFYKDKFEKQAKMTDAEKLSQERTDWKVQMDKDKIEINQDHAKVLLEKAGIIDEEQELFLELVTSDKAASIGKITRICESRTKSLDATKQKIVDELNSKSGNFKYGSSEKLSNEDAQKMTIRERTVLKAESPELYKFYFGKK